jgi:hypothetical protein
LLVLVVDLFRQDRGRPLRSELTLGEPREQLAIGVWLRQPTCVTYVGRRPAPAPTLPGELYQQWVTPQQIPSLLIRRSTTGC